MRLFLFILCFIPAVISRAGAPVEIPDSVEATGTTLGTEIIEQSTLTRSQQFMLDWERHYRMDYRVRPIGFQVGYTMKWFVHNENGRRRSCTFFGNPGHNSGILFGVPYQPVFYKGLGIDTGLFAEIYACKDGQDVYRVEDVGMFVPVRAMYRFPFRRDVSVFVTTGVQFDVGIRLNLKNAEDTDAGTQKLNYNDNTPRRFNAYYDIGGGFRIKQFQLTVIYSLGLTANKRFFSINATGNTYVNVYPSKVAFTAGLMF